MWAGKKPAAMLVLGALLLLLAGCGERHAAEETYILVSANVKVPYWQNAEAGLFAAARELKVKAQVLGPDTYDPQAEKQALQDAIRQRPAGIMISATDPALLKPEIDQAIAQGIPLITIDSDAPDTDRLLFVGTNNYQAGLVGGRMLAEHVKGKANVVFFTMPEQANLRERLDGYRTAFAEHSGMKVVEVVDIKGDPRIAFDAAKQIVEQRRQEVDAFVCLEALAGKEVAEILNRFEVKDKVVMAMDTDEATLEWIRRGVILATIAQKPYTMSYYGLKILDDLHHHPLDDMKKNWAQETFARIPRFVDTGATLIDRQNVDAFFTQQEAAKGGN